jgi:hypothetical protein
LVSFYGFLIILLFYIFIARTEPFLLDIPFLLNPLELFTLLLLLNPDLDDAKTLEELPSKLT